MFRILKMKYLSLTIEVHWGIIKKYRNKGVQMINNGTPLSSPKLLSFDKHIRKHGRLVIIAQKQYKDLCGLQIS